MNTSRKLWLAGALAAALTLGGCFGSDGDDAPAPGASTTVPDSAGASVGAFIAYLLALSPDDETSEPATISDAFAVPPDEDGEPQPLV